MPSKLAIAFLGMVVGGSAFTFAGLTTFLTVNQLQDRQISDYSGPDFSPSSPSAVRATISVSSGIALSMIRVSIEKRADPIRDTGSLDGQLNRDPAQAEQ